MIEIGPVEEASELHVYQYHHLDYLAFAKSPGEIFQDTSSTTVSAYVEAVGKRFQSAGWEGDGVIEVIWFPPFVDVGIEDTWGTYVWHVKQGNNGTSWLGSSASLNFKRLLAQNEPWLEKTHILVGVTYNQCFGFARRVANFFSRLDRQLQSLRQSSDPFFPEIEYQLLIFTQGELIAQLMLFLDDCYHEILMEVLKHGNQSKIHLSKFRANFEPRTYIPEDIEPENDTDANQWFTIHGIIRDIWRTYKFEPFTQKVDMLLKACNYDIDSSLSAKLKKHVLLRNCAQHDERRVSADALKQAGVSAFKMLKDDGTIKELAAWEPIEFSLSELRDFAKSLIEFSSSFYTHTYKRIRRKNWIPRGSNSLAAQPPL